MPGGIPGGIPGIIPGGGLIWPPPPGGAKPGENGMFGGGNGRPAGGEPAMPGVGGGKGRGGMPGIPGGKPFGGGGKPAQDVSSFISVNLSQRVWSTRW